MITDLLKFTIKEEYIVDAAELMKKQMKDNLADQGCLISKAFRSKTDTSEIYMLLGWEDQTAIDKHLKTDHDQQFIKDLDPMLVKQPEFFDWETIA